MLPWQKNNIRSYMPLCKNIECTEESVGVGNGLCQACMKEKIHEAIMNPYINSMTEKKHGVNSGKE